MSASAIEPLFLLTMSRKSVIFLHELGPSLSAARSWLTSGLVTPLDRFRSMMYCIRLLVWVGASITVTTKLSDLLLPAASNAVHVTVLGPTGKMVPEVLVQAKELTPTLSLALELN